MGMMELLDSKQSVRPLGQLKLPQLTRAMAQQRTALARRKVTGEATLLGRPLQFEDVLVDHNILSPATILNITVGEQDLKIVFRGDLQSFIESISDGHPVNPDLSPDMAGFVVEHLLSEDLDHLENSFETQIVINGVQSGRDFDTAGAHLALRMMMGGEQLGIVYVVSDTPDTLLTRMTATFPAHTPRPLPMINVTTSLVGPMALMSRREALVVRQGDIFRLAPDWDAIDSHLYLMIRNNQVCRMRAVEQGTVIDGDMQAISELRSEYEKEHLMTTSDQDKPKTALDPQVLVTVEFYRSELPVSQLGALAAGDVLDFDISSVEDVKICADGTVVAEGRLVRIEDTYGVQVSKLL